MIQMGTIREEWKTNNPFKSAKVHPANNDSLCVHRDYQLSVPKRRLKQRVVSSGDVHIYYSGSLTAKPDDNHNITVTHWKQIVEQQKLSRGTFLIFFSWKLCYIKKVADTLFANPRVNIFVCFSDMHKLFVACVGSEPQRTTCASLVLNSTVCTCKFNGLNLCLYASCCFLRYN